METFVPVNIAYKEYIPREGSDSGFAPIIFLHGMTATKEDWLDIPQILASQTKRKAYAIDLRNHGDSGYSDVADLDTSVSDLFHFMDNTLKVQKAVLVGHSMGGITAFKAALREPERVEMLFVEDMYTRKCSSEFFAKLEGFLKLFLAGVENVPKNHPESEITSWVIDFMCRNSPPDSPIHEEKESLCKSNYQFHKKPDGSYDVKFNKEVILKMVRDPPSSSELSGQYDGPAYFVYGGKSKFFVGKEEEDIKKHFPTAMLIEIKEANHNIHSEYREEFIHVLNKRLSLKTGS